MSSISDPMTTFASSSSPMTNASLSTGRSIARRADAPIVWKAATSRVPLGSRVWMNSAAEPCQGRIAWDGRPPTERHQRGRAVADDRVGAERGRDRAVDRRGAAEGHRDDHDRRGRRVGVLRAGHDGALADHRARLLGLGRRAIGVARADRDVVAGLRETQREPEALRAGAADDRHVHGCSLAGSVGTVTGVTAAIEALVGSACIAMGVGVLDASDARCSAASRSCSRWPAWSRS